MALVSRLLGLRTIDLHPSARTEFLRIARRQHLELRGRVLLEVERARRVLESEPCRSHEIRDDYAVDVISVLVVFHGVTDFVCPERAAAVLRSQIDVGIHRHLADLMRRAYADAGVV